MKDYRFIFLFLFFLDLIPGKFPTVWKKGSSLPTSSLLFSHGQLSFPMPIASHRRASEGQIMHTIKECGSNERCSVHRMQPSCCILPSPPQSVEVGADTGLGWCLFVGIQAMRAYLEAHHNYDQPTVVLVAVVVSDFMLCSWLVSKAAVVIK